LREIYLPPFEYGIKAGSKTVMVNSAEVNGIPGNSNSYYIDAILKGELKFEGFVTSDWEDIKRLHTRDKIAESEQDAVRIAGINLIKILIEYIYYLFFE
jgi:beta-glucosidase